jgi:hypothetical protein
MVPAPMTGLSMHRVNYSHKKRSFCLRHSVCSAEPVSCGLAPGSEPERQLQGQKLTGQRAFTLVGFVPQRISGFWAYPLRHLMLPMAPTPSPRLMIDSRASAMRVPETNNPAASASPSRRPKRLEVVRKTRICDLPQSRLNSINRECRRSSPPSSPRAGRDRKMGCSILLGSLL